MGDVKVAIIPITDENRSDLIKLAMSVYLGEKCVCGHKFKTLDELKEIVWFPHNGGRIAHKKCYISRQKKESG